MAASIVRVTAASDLIQPCAQVGGQFSADGGPCPGGAQQPLQRQPRFAGTAAQVDVVTRLRCTAPQLAARPHFAEHGDADVQRAPRGVAAYQRAGVRVGQREQAARKGGEPGVVGLRQ